jgi:3-phenylpropionate/cinnamic acid dioxygenase small subunit
MDDDVVCEVERFLYREAQLLDERRLHQRLEVLTDDIRYWMAGRTQPLSEVEQGDCDPRSLSATSRTM